MKTTCLFICSVFFFSFYSCEKIEEQLTKVEPYEIVGEHDTQLDNDKRTARAYFITSSADDFESFAQTCIKAAIDIHKKNKKLDLVEVFMVPDKELISSSQVYAFAYYATDKKGLKFASGADQNTMVDFQWLVRAAEQSVSDRELQMAKLWYIHQKDFPSDDPLSSLSYNKEKLVNFIAGELGIDVSEVYLPQISLKEYKELDFLGQ